MSELNREILRWVLLIGAAPVWWPFLRTLWRDFNSALREEGGLFGRLPSPRELERIQSELDARPQTLLSERIVRAGERRNPKLGARRPNSRARGPARGDASTPAAPRTSAPRFR